VATFELNRDAYSTLRAATSLSPGALAALEGAEALDGGERRKVTCSREVAEELRGWCRDAERAFLSMRGHEPRSAAFRLAIEAIDGALG
jgi:hypothetical protein